MNKVHRKQGNPQAPLQALAETQPRLKSKPKSISKPRPTSSSVTVIQKGLGNIVAANPREASRTNFVKFLRKGWKSRARSPQEASETNPF